MAIYNPMGLPTGQFDIAARRPYIATSGPNKGHPVITVNSGQMDQNGMPLFTERRIQTNATLRKDEWIKLDQEVMRAAQERLVIVDDLISAGLTYDAGGLGTQIVEWETASEMTDAVATMDGESKGEKDRVEFGLNGVPIPIIHKEFSISERAQLASRTRGAGLDVVNGEAAARAVARKSEDMIFNGLTMGSVNSSGNSYQVYGLLNTPGKPMYQIGDWSSDAYTPAQILADINAMVAELETDHRAFGPYNLYIPAAYSRRFREDFKANSDKTLMGRLLEESYMSKVRVSDTLPTGTVLLIEMSKRTIDLAIASNLTTVQWSSGSGWTNHFQTYAAWAPRIKADHGDRFGYIVGSTST